MPAGELPTAASYRSEPTTCHSRPILEADEHFRLVGVGAELMRKSFVNAALASTRIHGAPNCFSALRICWQHVPIGRWLVDHGRRGPMQTNVILTGAAVPNADCAFSTPLQITPNVAFGNRGAPSCWDADRPARGAETSHASPFRV